MLTPLSIIYYPDPRLRQVSTPVTEFDEKLRTLCAMMIDLMREDKGVGLAAPQVGVNRRLFVMNATGDPSEDQFIINPVLSDAAGNELDEEGCLSLPKLRAEIERAASVTLEYQDITGATCRQSATGFVARIWQHEVDHLDGIMLMDRMGYTARMGARRRLKELEADFERCKDASSIKRKRSAAI